MAELPRDIPGENLKRWLARTPEEPIDPGQPIVDPHHHLWDRRPRPETARDGRQQLRYLADDLVEDIRGAGHNVVDTVFVECRSMYSGTPSSGSRTTWGCQWKSALICSIDGGSQLLDGANANGVLILGELDSVVSVNNARCLNRCSAWAGADAKSETRAMNVS